MVIFQYHLINLKNILLVREFIQIKRCKNLHIWTTNICSIIIILNTKLLNYAGGLQVVALAKLLK
jgi:hypothetical protein